MSFPRSIVAWTGKTHCVKPRDDRGEIDPRGNDTGRPNYTIKQLLLGNATYHALFFLT
ncbi:MAG: hypothetical protein ACEY3D_06095 [Rickettsia sp.]|uniref:hypothetical protein n=1 Tax=Rickettsia sp. TaxID=789 RepID=UPI00397B2B65